MFLGSTQNAWISGGTDKIETVTMFTIYGKRKRVNIQLIPNIPAKRF